MKRCGNCGSRELAKKDQRNKTFPWRDFPAAPLLVNIEFLECHNCHELTMSAADFLKLDEALKESVTRVVRSMIEAIRSREKCEQNEIATHLGLSPEYLSELKSGRKPPSFSAFNFLKTLFLAHGSFQVSDPNYLKPLERTA